MRTALAERTAGWSDLVASFGDLRVAESRIAHPDHTLVSDIEQLRAVTREQSARDAANGAARRGRAARNRARRGARRGARHRRSRAPLGGARGRAAARCPGHGRGRACRRAAAARGRAAERAQSAAERLSQLESLVRSASPSGDEADALERLHAAATRRVAADQRERSLVAGVPELDGLLADGARARGEGRAPAALRRRARDARGRVPRGACTRRGADAARAGPERRARPARQPRARSATWRASCAPSRRS